jgi:hypothetical protein
MNKALIAAVLAGASGVAGAANAEPLVSGLTLDVSASLLAAVQQPEAKPAAPDTKPLFGDFVKGRESVWYITVGGGVAADGDPDTHYNGFVALSTFIGDRLEVQLEGNGWYFDQDPDSTEGAGFSVNLRWHFWRGSWGGGGGGRSDDLTFYVDAGIGLIFSGDDVPDGGSSVNLAPRAGIGFTARLGDSNTRLVGGVRWHHMSNARADGDSNNPDFNAPLFYIGLEWPL